MDYRWFGAIHLIAAVVWVSGLLLLAITAYIYSENQHGNAVDKSWFRHILKWNRKVITPAMLVLWGCGIVLISKAGLFHSWILMKLAILIFLSALHGTLSKSIRMLASGEHINARLTIRRGASIIILAISVIIFLAKFKPVLF
ncbi:putative membrane protein [Raoultella sp. BIGb0149]|uniref:CopD family protein n=1 Tax=Raoultella sp. BIGb0149 TaxID=2485116 RepID=UPI0010607A45|nr:CopD family protein [Raoultella sp. BIGb0149]TDQ24810.1 putative membrane protein [Raoultella sp. BIGb0149]